jgi:hypothetical protein
MTASLTPRARALADKRGANGKRFFTLTDQAEFQVWDWCATSSVSARFFLGLYRYRFADGSVLYLKRWKSRTIGFVA